MSRAPAIGKLDRARTRKLQTASQQTSSEGRKGREPREGGERTIIVVHLHLHLHRHRGTPLCTPHTSHTPNQKESDSHCLSLPGATQSCHSFNQHTQPTFKMKYTFATIAAFASVALATPTFLNSNWDVQEGKPFTIKYSGCEGGCTITLQNGKSTDTKDVTVLTATAEGDSFTFTPGDLPSDTYNFKIKNNDDGTINYSSQFSYQGTGAPKTTEETTTAAETKSVEETSTEETSAPATTEATTLTTVSKPVSITTHKARTTVEPDTTVNTPIATKNATTPIPTTKKATSTGGASSTEGSETTAAETSAAATGSATTVPESGAARMTSSLALIAGAVMAMVYLN